MADKGEFRSIYVALLDSWEFQELSACARSCLTTLKLKLGKAGIDVFAPETLPRYTGFPAEACSAALGELQDARWILVERNVYWLRNGLRFEPSDPLSNSNGRKGIENHLKTLPDLPIVSAFAAYYGLKSPYSGGGDGSPSGGASKGVGKPLRTTDDGIRKTEEVQSGSAREGREPDPIPEDVTGQAMLLIRTANRAMLDHPAIDPDRFRPIPEGHGTLQDVIDWLQRDGVPLPVAQHAIRESVRDYAPGEEYAQIERMTYFARPIERAHARWKAGQLELPDLPPPSPREVIPLANGRRGRGERAPIDAQEYTPKPYKGLNY